MLFGANSPPKPNLTARFLPFISPSSFACCPERKTDVMGGGGRDRGRREQGGNLETARSPPPLILTNGLLRYLSPHFSLSMCWRRRRKRGDFRVSCLLGPSVPHARMSEQQPSHQQSFGSTPPPPPRSCLMGSGAAATTQKWRCARCSFVSFPQKRKVFAN